MSEGSPFPGDETEQWAHLAYGTLRLLAITASMSPVLRMMAGEVVRSAPDDLAERCGMALDVTSVTVGVPLPPLPSKEEYLHDIMTSGNPHDLAYLLRLMVQRQEGEDNA